MGLSKSQLYSGGKYLSQKDITEAGGTIVATIADVRVETVKGDTEEELPVVHFKEKVNPLVCKPVNYDLIDAIAGGHDDLDTWLGVKVEFYIDPGVTFGGKKTGGIRARPPRSAATPNGAPLPLAWTIEQAIEAAAKIGKSRDQLVAMLKDKGLTGWNAAKCTPIVQAWIDENELPF